MFDYELDLVLFRKNADDEGTTGIVHTAGQRGFICNTERDVDPDVLGGGVGGHRRDVVKKHWYSRDQ